MSLWLFCDLRGRAPLIFVGRLKGRQASRAASDLLLAPVASMAPHLTPAELDFAMQLQPLALVVTRVAFFLVAKPVLARSRDAIGSDASAGQTNGVRAGVEKEGGSGRPGPGAVR